MRLKFTGQYTNGHTSITYEGVTFEGYEPAECPPELAARLLKSEFEAVDPLDGDGNGEKGGSLPDAPDEELEALRARYEELAGKKPHHMMKAARLIDEILKLEAE